MCRILLSINPEYVEKILAQTKRFEYRRNRCKSYVDTIVIYSTYPVMKVVGEVEVLGVIEDDVDIVWNQTKDYSGVSKDFFDAYFKGRQTAVAYKLGKIKRYKQPLRLSDLGVRAAPQSFVYLHR